MTDDADKQCEESGAGDRIVMIPASQRYEIDCWGNAIKQVEGGEWVRYDDHVAAVKLMRSEVEKLEEQVAELKKNLRDAELDANDLQNMLRRFKQ